LLCPGHTSQLIILTAAGDIVMGNISASRKLVRTLTCAKIASVANVAAYNPQVVCNSHVASACVMMRLMDRLSQTPHVFGFFCVKRPVYFA
jgi:hypothetical protein